jgi:hypothetical protein
MRPFRPEQFSSLLANNEKMALGLDPYLAEIANNNMYALPYADNAPLE